MALRNIREMGDPVLNKVCKEVKEITPRTRELIQDMVETMYDANGVAFWPAQVVNYTTKTQYLYRISKGCLEEIDKSVNKRIKPEERTIPFKRMLYIGDGLTDVPCMATLKKFGGYAAAVYTPSKKGNKKIANELLAEGRVDIIAPADYQEGSRMDVYVKALLCKLKAEYDLQNL